MSSLNFIAILGRQPELGLVELESLAGPAAIVPYGRAAALVPAGIEVDRLGGVQKIGQILYRGAAFDLQHLPLEGVDLPRGESKLPFAVSVYGLRVTPREVMAAGLSLKKRLREGGSVRLVAPAKGSSVSAAELKHNRVVEDGFELMIVSHGREMVLARTLGVQDIDWYSKRDYGRPSRSAKVGMLPPKLAQALVNSTAAPVVVDPFCGTGVVLQEALLLGRSVVGSDASEDMVAATEANLAWLRQSVDEALPEAAVKLADAREIQLPEGCAVVSEGYLGPNLSTRPSGSSLAAIKTELLSLYRECLTHWAGQLPAGADVSICVPAWRLDRGWAYLGLVDELADLGYTLKGFKHVRTPLLYAREDQIVGRQLLLLRKN